MPATITSKSNASDASAIFLAAGLDTSMEATGTSPGTTESKFIKWFSEISIGDIPIVGGKNASLGEMCRELIPKGVKVPDGFAITAEAYRYFLREAKLDQKIRALLGDLDTGDMENLRQRGFQV